MKIAIGQINPIIGAYKHNSEKILSFCQKAKDQSCDLIVFSEMVLTGYPPRDLLENPDFVSEGASWLNRLIGSIRDIGVILGTVEPNPMDEGNPLFNSAVMFENGQILQRIYKRLLPTYDVFDESRYFETGSDFSVIRYKGFTIGLTICEDIWNDKDIFNRRLYHVEPVSRLIDLGADTIINISASPYTTGKQIIKEKLLGKISGNYEVNLIYANQVGGNDSVLFDGLSMAFDASGKMIARAADFREDMVIADIDGKLAEADIHPASQTEPESIFNALVMGTRDYVQKCGFSKAVIGLSGGIDSALTACVAVKALESQNVSTVFMPSQYTSPDNFDDTRQLAGNLGVRYTVIPIDTIFQAFLPFISPDFDPKLPGVTEQNIQARIRGTLLMGLSNKYDCLVLSTGNKSELAVGYCTLYGDMNGGLSVISDVPKTMVYQIADYINGKAEIIPQRIIDKEPSAELKPDQTDQDELPPYEVLDSILKAHIEEAKGPNELVAMGFDPETVADILTKVARNEYKRHQAAPGLKVTSKAFGYGRRYPLAQRYRPGIRNLKQPKQWRNE
jgi:NAD+ synthetase